MQTLGGSTFVYNGIKQDYNFLETIHCLMDLCDEVSIVYGGDDGTVEAVEKFISEYRHDSHVVENIYLTELDKDTWDAHHSREKLAHFMNVAIQRLKTDYACILQADEVLFDRSFKNIREAIELGHESYVIARYNAWRDPLSMLDVPQESKPCSTEVVRLCRMPAWMYGDGEQALVSSVKAYNDDIYSIEMYHAGFVRNPIKFAVKARHMLVDIFKMQWDERIGDKLDYRKFPFTDDQIIPIPLPLPSYLVAWLKERHPQIDL